MIARVTAETVRSWEVRDEASLRILSQFAAYGDGQGFLRFYQDDGGCYLSLMDDVATLSAVGETSEMRLMLQMDSTVRHIRTDRDTAALIAAERGLPFDTNAVMQASLLDASGGRAQFLELKAIYPVLVRGFGDAIPPFDSWYADAHHRFRRGLCRAVGLCDGDAVVAVAMTVAECEKEALIGAVTTLPEARGKGYASDCVNTLTARLQREGKRVWLSPKNDPAKRLYERLGFVACGEWGSLSIYE
ncbi:MAG: GNAT family N-acetyltransferase [Clostridia bacterium]|nr:GNAT family N-acetyltransferase [Clostridia bacterium]